jgi:di/tricarboxylate transporter
MTAQVTALLLFVAIFAVATMREAHIGILMFAAASGVGVFLGEMPVADVVGGFPTGIMILLVGVTYFFGIARANGTVDRVVEAALGQVGERAVLLPFVFFAATAVVAAMGAPLAGLVMAPIGMPVAKKSRIDPMLMAIAIGSGLGAGAFAPTSLFGIVSYGAARRASIDLSPLALLSVAAIANLVLLMAAFLLFGGLELFGRRGTSSTPAASVGSRAPFTGRQIATLVSMFGLIVAILAGALAGLNPDVGVLSFAFGAVLTLIDPDAGRTAVARIDWSTVLLVGGIITFVSVLQHMGSVDLLGETARNVGMPVLAALLICVIGALVSAFASTTGILAALVPLAPPVVASGQIPGWALIGSLAVCSSIVDLSPFSTVGATLVATADEEDRRRMTTLLTRWGLSLVVIGPLVLVAILVLPRAL